MLNGWMLLKKCPENGRKKGGGGGHRMAGSTNLSYFLTYVLYKRITSPDKACDGFDYS